MTHHRKPTAANQLTTRDTSTELVAKAIAKLVGSGAALGGVLVDTANRIHRANGSYGDIENVVTHSMGGMHGPK